MVDQSSNHAGISEIHPQFDAWIYGAAAIPEWNIHDVTKEGFVHRRAIQFFYEKMDLVNVKGVQFPGAIFDNPGFHISLSGSDVGAGSSGIRKPCVKSS
jgi:hypothetical protein